jgi:hypothetical protein
MAVKRAARPYKSTTKIDSLWRTLRPLKPAGRARTADKALGDGEDGPVSVLDDHAVAARLGQRPCLPDAGDLAEGAVMFTVNVNVLAILHTKQTCARGGAGGR